MGLIPSPWPMALTGMAALALGSGIGWKLRDGDYQRHLKQDAQLDAKAVTLARAAEQASLKASEVIRSQQETKEAAIRTVYRTITKEVPVYVPQSSPASQALDTAGGLPLGLVWSYNAALLGGDPQSASVPGLSSSDPSGVDLPTLARVEAGNLEVLNICRSRLEAWDKFYGELRASWPTGASGTSTTTSSRAAAQGKSSGSPARP
jgi:hypothetical protein